jgi:tetratricopeptide (TPR) repeat protein
MIRRLPIRTAAGAALLGAVLGVASVPARAQEAGPAKPAQPPAATAPRPSATKRSSTSITVKPKVDPPAAAPGDAVGKARPGVNTPVDPRYNQLMRNAARQASQGQHLIASRTYAEILNTWPGDLNATRGCADELVALGQLESAEKLLAEWRREHGADSGIDRSLATVHRAQERWDDYLADVVRALDDPGPGQEPPVSWALRSFEEIGAQPTMAAKVEPAVRKLVRDNPGKPALKILLADRLLRAGNETQALAEVVEADRASKSGGRLIAEFAEELDVQGKGGLAESAFRKAAEAAGTEEAKIAAWTRLGELAARNQHPKVQVEAWQAIAGLAPQKPEALAALQSLADAQLYRLHDHAGALATLQKLEANPAMTERKGELYLPMAECQFRLEKPDEALTTLERLKGSKADAEAQAEGAFLAAEIHFFQGRFDDAQPAYQTVAENFTRTRKTNDAVGRYLQIARAKDQQDLEALKAYATMEKFNRMADTTATWNAATELMTKFAASDLAADAMVRQAEILRARPGQSEDAIALCEKAVAEHPRARSAAYALAVMGDICLKDLNDKKRALAAYERLLDEYPQNLLAAEVRRTVERLRKSNES